MFELHYEKWLAEQRKGLSGEALRRFMEGHGHAERSFAEIWWQAVGHFEYLHAEYMVPNYRNGSYFLDFAYLRPPYRINWEVDDFATHGQHVNRRSFDYERDRQNDLMLDGWQIYRSTLDTVKERPRKCQQDILRVLGKLYGGGLAEQIQLPMKQREIMRYAIQNLEPITPAGVCHQLEIKSEHARELLHQLVQLELLVPASGSLRIRSYKLGPKASIWRL